MRRVLLVIEFLIGLAFIALVAIPLLDSVQFLKEFNENTIITFQSDNADLYKYLVYGLGISFVLLFIVLMILPSRRKGYGGKSVKSKENVRESAPVAAAAESETAASIADTETAAAYQYVPQYVPPSNKVQEWPDEAFRSAPEPVQAPAQQYEPEPYTAPVTVFAPVEEPRIVYSDPRFPETREDVVVPPDRTVKPAGSSQPWAKEPKPRTPRQSKTTTEKPVSAPIEKPAPAPKTAAAKPASSKVAAAKSPKPKAEPKQSPIPRSARQPEALNWSGNDDGKPPFKLD
jgi:hypothetical protein